MPKLAAKRPIIQYTTDEGVQVQPKNGKEMQDLLRKARLTMMRLDTENQTLKRLQASTKMFCPKPDCDAETSTDDIPKRKKIIKRKVFVRKGLDFNLDAINTLDSVVDTSNSKIRKVHKETVRFQEPPNTRQILSDFGSIMEKKRTSLKRQVSTFQKELNDDVKKMLRKSKKDSPQVTSLKESFDRIGRLIANIKNDLEIPEKSSEKTIETELLDSSIKNDKHKRIAEKLRELSKGEDLDIEVLK